MSVHGLVGNVKDVKLKDATTVVVTLEVGMKGTKPHLESLAEFMEEGKTLIVDLLEKEEQRRLPFGGTTEVHIHNHAAPNQTQIPVPEQPKGETATPQSDPAAEPEKPKRSRSKSKEIPQADAPATPDPGPKAEEDDENVVHCPDCGFPMVPDVGGMKCNECAAYRTDEQVAKLKIKQANERAAKLAAEQAEQGASDDDLPF